jgi:hypothetical protein
MVRKSGLFLIGVLFMTCSSAPARAPAPVSYPVPVAVPAESKPADELDAAIRETSDYLNKQLPKGNKLVVLNIQSEYPALSEYIIDELIANTVNDRVFTVVDRQQLDTLRQELDFQMSGEVDDDTAQALGRIAGAQIIVSGAVSKIGDLYRLRVRALSVQSAQIEGQFNRNIPDGPTVAALARSQATGYGDSGGRPAAAPARAATAPAAVTPPVAAAPAPVAPAAPAPVTAPTPIPAAPTAPPAPTYKVGDTGPAGGIVFYDKGNNSDGWRYLEAASRDAGKAQWSPRGNPLSRTSTELGMGKGNTDYIERYLRENGASNCAAQLCLSYSQGEYSDWFLPSKDELNLLYTNLELKGLGGFSVGWYWSSSQADDGRAWCQRFSDGLQDYYSTGGKTNSYSVRATRAF